MKRSLESILFGLSGINLSVALLLLLLTSVGCADGVGEDGNSFGICADTAPDCFADCDASEMVDAVCEGGEWSCPDGAVDPEGAECQSDTCEGFPEGCRSSCVDDQSYVDPTCDDGVWRCEDSVSDSACYDNTCEIQTESTLPGVTITIGMDTCTWTTYEVRDGFEIPYTIEVESPVDVRRTAQDAGGCGTQTHPLDPFYRFTGDDEQHCLCDVGLCMQDDAWVAIDPGTYELTVEWSGRTWSGPSDTGNSPGEYFPTGTYEFSVVAKGEYRDSAGDISSYRVSGFMDFELIE